MGLLMLQALDLALLLQDIVAADALKQNLSGSLNGEITVKGGFDAPETAWQFDTGTAKSSGLVQLQNDTALGQQTVLLKKAQILPNGGGEMNAQGRLELFKNQALQLAINSKDFNPGKLNPAFPDGRVNGDINVTGELANNIFSGKMQFGPSVLSGVPLRGSADVREIEKIAVDERIGIDNATWQKLATIMFVVATGITFLVGLFMPYRLHGRRPDPLQTQ